MKYELDVLAALTQLNQPSTQEIVAATGISERKVQNVIKYLQADLNVGIDKIKKGRAICYVVTSWGVFESGALLKRTLSRKILNENNTTSIKARKVSFYNTVKMSNYKESTRLEGISIHPDITPKDHKSIAGAKQTLIEKYSKYKNMSSVHG